MAAEEPRRVPGVRRPHQWKRAQNERGEYLLAMECERCGVVWNPEKFEKQLGECCG